MTGSVPVLVVGAGPAGMTLALLLARFGIESEVVEQRREFSRLPRATGINLRAMEVLRSLGLQEEVDDASMPMLEETPFVLVGQTLATPPEATIFSDHWGRRVDPEWPSPCFANWCAQDELEGVLRFALRQAAQPILLGQRLESLEVQSDGVHALVRDVDSGEGREVFARFVIGADGASSVVRERAGIGMTGEHAVSDQVLILFEAELGEILGARRFCIYALHGPPWSGTVRPAGGSQRWIFDVHGETDPSHERCLAMVRDIAERSDLEVRILATARWRASARVADTFLAGPILLVGDAAHEHSPGGGFGMNSAIQGAHNLAWKLAYVLHGWAGDPLLDTYEAERRPLALLTTGLSLKLLRQRGAGSGRTLGLVLGASYASGAVLNDSSADKSQGADDGRYIPSSAPGHRAPHAWLDADAGLSTLDLFHTNFVLLCAGERGKVVNRVPVDVQQLPPSVAKLYGLAPAGAVLVRPDGYVAARWADEADVERALSRLLGAGP